LDPRDDLALAIAGHLTTLLTKRHDEALQLFAQALTVNPSSVWAWARSATTLAYLGRADEAMERVQRAIKLSPFDRAMFSFFTTAGTAALVAERADEAVAWFGKALRLNPHFSAARRLLVAALIGAGEFAEARAVAQELLEAHPGFSISAFGRWYPMTEPHLGRLLGALHAGGLPS
jgi:tetratricopeptide (TPR) repeat protein